MGETKIIYHLDDQETPYLIKLPLPADKVTLHDLKTALNKPSYKYFFKSMDDDFGVVKEEIIDDSANLPCYNGRVVTWLVSSEGSTHSDTQSQAADSSIAPSPSKPAHKSSCTANPQNRSSPAKSVAKENNVENGQNKPVAQPQVNGHNQQHQALVHRPPARHHASHRGAASSVMSSDIETTSFVDSEDDASTRFSTTTETTHRSSHFNKRRRRKHRLPVISRASSFSSITDSTMSLNIVTVQLNMDTANFLGISIVGQSNKGGDGGIYVGSIMKGGAVAQDGRIEPGDMILEVNGVSFENMSNDDAVRTLRQAVQKSGPITLVVAKCWDPNPRGYMMMPPPRQEPVRPIDPSAWVMHTEAVRQQQQQGGWGPYGGGGWGGGWGPMGAPSMSTLTSTSSSIISSVPANEYIRKPQHSSATSSSSHSSRSYTDLNLTKQTDMAAVVRAMSQPDSGLEVRDRQWLKLSIPNAFIGSELVDWLHTRVEGFADRRDARRYACNLLKAGFIQHTTNKITFSEQCYYVFGTNIPPVNMADLSLDDIDSVSSVGIGTRPMMCSGGADQDSLGPLPTPPAWNTRPIQPYRQPQFYAPPGALGINNGCLNPHIPSYATPAGLKGGSDAMSYVSMPGMNGAESVVSDLTAKHDKTCACIVSHTYKQIRRLWDNPDKSNAQQNTMRMMGKFDADIDRSTSSDTGSSDSESSQSNGGAVKQKNDSAAAAGENKTDGKWPASAGVADRSLPPPPPPRDLDKSKNSELDASRQSFRMAMGNTITDDTLHVMGDL